MPSASTTGSGAYDGLPLVDYERHPSAATTPLPGKYKRREPEKTVLYAIVREHLETFLARPTLRGGLRYPRFVEREFRRYLDCGLLCRGFSRLRCAECGFERLVAYSCKGRLCPSCLARRTNDTAARLVDRLLPALPYRQWVLSFPFNLRFALARRPTLHGKLVGAFLGIVFAWQRHRGRRLGVDGGQTGSVTFLQRFGGALNCNPHAHCIVPDGLFVQDPDGANVLAFVRLPPPSDEEVALLTRRIARRLTAIARRILGEDGENFVDDEEDEAAVRDDVAAALRPPLAVVPQQSVLPLDLAAPTPAKRLCAAVNGFSLHAARTVEASDRKGLERLCRYGLRSPISQERLSLRPDGRVVYRLARPWPTPAGRTELVLDPVDFLRRLGALIPPPYTNLVRYHGVFANRSRYRRQLPPPPPPAPTAAPAGDSADTEPLPAIAPRRSRSAAPPSSAAATSRPSRTPWAALLRRVFGVDSLSCPKCAAQMVVLAFITDPRVLHKVLEHLGLPTSPPPIPPPSLPPHT
ncbi:transposase [bacterium]|nr:transposase [bacterium]